MLGRTSSAAGLLLLLAPALGAQATTEATPRLRAPRLATDSAVVTPLLPVRLADVPGSIPAVNLRFDPFTREARKAAVSERPSLPEPATLPRCPMPVERSDSSHDPMPVATPDSTTKYFIRVAPPGCVVESSR
ncbi:MAG TPA: hypothetical protein VFK04_16750 [Gemmatimonadaceae bacterium]|jgi:hypothetical protein|nr:hypothetical protein [Gemmatimonadaceae bacterium]